MKKTLLPFLFCCYCSFIIAQQPFQTSVLFQFDQSTLTSEAKNEIDKSIFNSLENIQSINLVGHTDSDGNPFYNEKLSLKRVDAVLNHLVSLGIDQSLVTTNFQGESQPVATNLTAQGKQFNRRVDMTIFYHSTQNIPISKTVNELITNSIQEENFIIPENFQVPFKSFKVNNDKDVSIELDDKGTVLHIPKNCFVDENGHPVTTPITIKYREYKNSADMAFSNIPMTYKQNGEEFFFNSSGMFEIKGNTNGKEVFIAEGQELTIDYALAKQNPDISFFQLNDEDNWENIQEIAPKNNVGQDAQLIEAMGEWNVHKFTEVNNIRLVTKNQIDTGDVEVFVTKRDKIIGEGEIINNEFKGQLKLLWNTKRNRRAVDALVQIRAKQLEWMEMNPQFNENIAIEANFEQGRLLAEGADAGHTYPPIIKGLNVKSFGVFNCDQIYRVPKRVNITANYLDEKGKPIQHQKVVSMMDLNYNGAFSFSPRRFTCSATGKNVLALFTKKGKLYLLDVEAFAKMDITRSGTYTFRMKDMTEKIKSSEDLAVYLGLK